MLKWLTQKTMRMPYMLDDDGGGAGGSGSQGGPEGGAGGEGGSGDGGGAGDGGTGSGGESAEELAAEKAKADQEAKVKADSEELEKLRSENAENKKFIDSINSNYEFDENGDLIKKGTKKNPEESHLTEEEKEAIRKQEEAAGRAAEAKIKAAESAKQAKGKIAETHADDPFFKENMSAAEKFMEKTPIEKQSEAYWEHAYAMAAGKKLKDYQKHYFDLGKAEGVKETTKQKESSAVGGEGTPASKGDDLSSVVLTPDQLRVANKMVADGMISSIDVYKKNVLKLAKQEKEEE